MTLLITLTVVACVTIAYAVWLQAMKAVKAAMQSGFNSGARYGMQHGDVVWWSRLAAIADPEKQQMLVDIYDNQVRVLRQMTEEAISNGATVPSSYGELAASEERIARVKAEIEGEKR